MGSVVRRQITCESGTIGSAHLIQGERVRPVERHFVFEHRLRGAERASEHLAVIHVIFEGGAVQSQ